MRIFTLFLPKKVSAQGLQALNKLQNFANRAGFTTVDVENPEEAQLQLGNLIGAVLSAILAFVGVIFMILIISAGYMWMTAAGNEDKVNQAKKIIKTSIIGLLIVALAFVITQLVGNIINESSLFRDTA